ncbi:MAG TPA: hypothetical protein VGO11_09475 [Chthoniobacteraceae bacterium]|jgi:hypothetical protein|nr:hypothetical protein [Chthoniobacteraceae bacterium]
MKLPPCFATLVLTLVATVSLHAEPPKIEHVIDLLQKAKDAADPLPILQHARKEFSDFNPVDANKLTAAGSGQRKTAGMEVAGHDRKHEAMEAIGHAIEAAKEKGDTKAKIESAIAKVHYAGALKH